MLMFDYDFMMKLSSMANLVGIYGCGILDCLINYELLLFDFVIIGRNYNFESLIKLVSTQIPLNHVGPIP